MLFWSFFAVVPILLLAVLTAVRPAWLPLAVPLSALLALASHWDVFCYYEGRPFLLLFLTAQALILLPAVLVLGRARKIRHYPSFCLDVLAALLSTGTLVLVPFRYLELEWHGGFRPDLPAPQAVLFWLIPLGAGVFLSLFFAKKLRRPE